MPSTEKQEPQVNLIKTKKAASSPSTASKMQSELKAKKPDAKQKTKPEVAAPTQQSAASAPEVAAPTQQSAASAPEVAAPTQQSAASAATKKKKLRVVIKKRTKVAPSVAQSKAKKPADAVSLGMPLTPLNRPPASFKQKNIQKSGSPPQKPGQKPRTAPSAAQPFQRSKLFETNTRFQKREPTLSAPPTQPSGTNKRFFKKKHEYKKKELPAEKDFFVNWKKQQISKINPVPSSIEITDAITVAELARKMNLKASELIQRLISMGMMVSINEGIDSETAEILAAEYQCTVKVVSLYDQTIIASEKDSEELMQPRAPIVTVLGHVDHGKTSLLDAIRNTKVVNTEHGAITQHIGAYQTKTEKGVITFLDTPGHEAFTQMRSRGAQITDIAVLVVAADDGVMPQTIEAISHARTADVPIIVAITKIDLPSANTERVRQRLSEHDLIAEEWGGKTLFTEVSAHTGEGIDSLLDAIILQAEFMELKANYSCRAEGKIIESMIDPGLGRTSTVLIQRGTLNVGDSFAAGIYPGKVRMLINDHNERITEALPSMPVRVIGFVGIPEPGDPFQVTENDKISRLVCQKRQELQQKKNVFNAKERAMGTLFKKEGNVEQQELKVIVKGDVLGSVEAIKQALEKLTVEKVKLTCIHASAGAINESDIMLAGASSAVIVGFNVRPTTKAQTLAEQEKVEIYKCSIVYDAIETIKALMTGLLEPELQESIVGNLKVRKVYKISRIGTIAGAYVTDGQIQRGIRIRLYRDGEKIYEGKIQSLKRFKDDVKSVEAGFECGFALDNFNDIHEGDIVEAYLQKEIAPELV